MDCSLALELKNNGFPNLSGNFPCKHGNWSLGLDRSCECSDDDVTRIPTLSELIEACGGRDGWFGLTEQPFESMKVWEARMNHGITREPEITRGSTPEEAVANLWLAINKK